MFSFGWNIIMFNCRDFVIVVDLIIVVFIEYLICMFYVVLSMLYIFSYYKNVVEGFIVLLVIL